MAKEVAKYSQESVDILIQGLERIQKEVAPESKINVIVVNSLWRFNIAKEKENGDGV